MRSLKSRPREPAKNLQVNLVLFGDHGALAMDPQSVPVNFSPLTNKATSGFSLKKPIETLASNGPKTDPLR